MMERKLDTRPIFGVGKRGGRRPKKYRVAKEDMATIIGQLYAMGFGSQIVGRMLGYSPAQIHWYARDFNLSPASAQVKADTMVDLLPNALKVAVRKIRMTSEIAHERKRAPQTPYTHLMVDDDESVI